MGLFADNFHLIFSVLSDNCYTSLDDSGPILFSNFSARLWLGLRWNVYSSRSFGKFCRPSNCNFVFSFPLSCTAKQWQTSGDLMLNPFAKSTWSWAKTLPDKFHQIFKRTLSGSQFVFLKHEPTKLIPIKWKRSGDVEWIVKGGHRETRTEKVSEHARKERVSWRHGGKGEGNFLRWSSY